MMQLNQTLFGTGVDVPSLVDMLIQLPERICEAQEVRDQARAHYARTTSRLATAALTMEVFRDKDGKNRIAANEKERELAIGYAIQASKSAQKQKEELDRAERELDRWQARAANYRMIARLVEAERLRPE